MEESGNDHDDNEPVKNDASLPGTASPDYLILDSGTCSTCNTTDTTSSSVCCLYCKWNFHALCKDEDHDKENNNICTKSFLGQYVTRFNQSKRTGNFYYLCDPCKTKIEDIQTCTTNDKVQKLDSKVSRLTQDIGDIKKLLMTKTAVPATTEQENTTSTSTVAPSVNGNVWSI